MGQVWSKADFDGINATGFEGGRGSALAVTSQNAGPDGQFNTSDDVLAPLNVAPVAFMPSKSLPGIRFSYVVAKRE